MLKTIMLTSALLMAAAPLTAQANTTIDECLVKHPTVTNTILLALQDTKALSDPNKNRPTAYYQIGMRITRYHKPTKETSETYTHYLVVMTKKGKCQAVRIDARYGYEPYVPYAAAVKMEGNGYDWEAKNFREKILPEHIGKPPENTGHGCEPWTKAMAEARAAKNLSLEGCSVNENKLPLFWTRLGKLLLQGQ